MFLIQSLMTLVMSAGTVPLVTAPPPVVAVAADAAFEPSLDERVEQAAHSFEAWFEGANDETRMGEMEKRIGDALGPFAIADLNATQLARLGTLILFEQKRMDEARDRARTFVDDPGVQGAAGAMLSAWLGLHLDKAIPDAGVIDGVIGHAAISQVGGGAPLYDLLGAWSRFHRDEGEVKARGQRIAGLLGQTVHSRMSVLDLERATALYDTLSGVLAWEQIKPVRGRLVAALEQKQAALSPSEPGLRGELDQLIAGLGLIGSPAPELDFAWSSDGFTASKLSDLKGRVVVLDFWATWCGPCVRSFPDIAKLTKHYEGYPVTVLGVTSLQGSHSFRGQKIDTAGDPQREYALMGEFRQKMGMTWPVVFSEQPVFNEAYGVGGIPHIAVIAPDGTVRHNGLHPTATPTEKKHAIINGLLAEFGLEHPKD